jgi:hypothetical protein
MMRLLTNHGCNIDSVIYTSMQILVLLENVALNPKYRAVGL